MTYTKARAQNTCATTSNSVLQHLTKYQCRDVIEGEFNGQYNAILPKKSDIQKDLNIFNKDMSYCNKSPIDNNT
jgi:hypothetical protein